MQFLPSTFAEYAWAAGTPDPNILDPHDAIFAAAAMLAKNGVSRDVRGAVFSYNHADWYVSGGFFLLFCFWGGGGRIELDLANCWQFLH